MLLWLRRLLSGRTQRTRTDQERLDELLRVGYRMQQAGELVLAERRYREIVALDPAHPDALYLLGELARRAGRANEAVLFHQRAVAARAGEPAFHIGLGAALKACGRKAEALAPLRQALLLEPQDAETLNDLGNALQELYALHEAQTAYRRAIALDPGLAQPHFNLGLLLRRLGRAREAAYSLQRAVDLNPSRPASFSELLFSLYFLDDLDGATFVAKHVEFGQRFASGLAALRPAGAPERAAGERLRIGIVSPDLRRNSVAFFAEPVLEHLDRDRFELTCYYTGTLVDDTTLRLRGYGHRWVDCAADSDAALAQRIAGERIDVLIDWTGHAAGNRLLALARRPASVQLTAAGMLTGVAAIDYRLTDREVDPPGAIHIPGTDRPLHLPGCLWCFRPLPAAPPVAAAPAIRTGRIAFGSFNHAGKLSPGVIRLWSRILLAVPRSVLVLKGFAFGSEPGRAYFRDAFGACGIDAERLRMLGMDTDDAVHLRRYGEIDLALDPFPFNGATTTCEALWMGVPVVTLDDRASPSPAARAGASLLRAVGLGRLVARDAEDYLRIAQRLAADTAELSSLRAGMRQRVLDSILTDGARFTRSLEALIS